MTLLADGGEMPPERRERLAAAGVKVDVRPVAALAEGEEAPVPVRFEDGSELELDGLLVAVTLHQRSRIAARLGVEFAPWPVSEETIAVDDANQTSVPASTRPATSAPRRPRWPERWRQARSPRPGSSTP